MATYRAPGVMVEESPPPQSIAPADVVTAALLGTAEDGPFTPQRVVSVADFHARYGGSLARPLAAHYLTPAVHGFFANGGGALVVLRTPAPLTPAALATALTDLAVPAWDDVSLLHLPEADPPMAHVLAAHAASRAQLVVLDAPRTTDATFDPEPAYPASSHLALYAPWLRIDAGAGVERAVPPGGHVLGAIVRSTRERGVYKAPGNLSLGGLLGLERQFNHREQDLLGPRGVNLIRAFTDRGLLIWGARTLQREGEAKYISVRRLLDFLQRSIQRGTQWAVFEPNGETLWTRLRHSVDSFLLAQWRDGALVGDRPERAFFVTCDRRTMTQLDIDAGRVICEIGVAVLKPAEFIVLRVALQAQPGALGVGWRDARA